MNEIGVGFEDNVISNVGSEQIVDKSKIGCQVSFFNK